MRSPYGAIVFAILAAGCDAPSTPPPAPRPQACSPQQNTPHSESISGRIAWSGPIPHADPVTTLRVQQNGTIVHVVRPAPNMPAIDAAGGLGGAVVYLRGIDPATARVWDRPPVTVEMHDERPMIRQGDDAPGSVGFVRRGDEITIVSRQSLFHSLRARGAAFWTLTLPDPDRPRSRRLDRGGSCGVIERCQLFLDARIFMGVRTSVLHRNGCRRPLEADRRAARGI